VWEAPKLPSSGRTWSSVLSGTHNNRAVHAGARSGGSRSSAISRKNLCKRHSGNGDLGHLEGDTAAVADDLGADLD
jgi:hypothetical protein